MDVKKLFRAVTPPFFVDVYRHLKSPHHSGYLWEGIYANYQDVPTMGEGYNGDVWINSRTASTKSLIEALEVGGTVPVTLGFRYSSLAFLAALVLQNNDIVRVLDFGGGMGVAYPQLRKSLCALDAVEYFVVDNQRSCEMGATLFRKDPHIHFHAQLDESIPDVDIVFISGVLQYIQDYQGIIQMLARYKPAYFLYTLLSAGDIPTYLSSQRNLKGSVFPAWFFNVHELEAIMARVGYELMFKASMQTEDHLNMANFRKDYRLNHMANLLFSRQVHPKGKDG